MADTKDMLLQLYPKADLSQFSFGPGSVTLNYKGRGYDVLAWGEKTPHYDPAVEKVLQNALGQSWATPSFPQTFTVNPKALYAIPSSPFHANPPDPATPLISMNIQVTPSRGFKFQPRDLFRNNTVKHTTAKESYTWLKSSNPRFWSQQLNFALWCATAGSGISYNMLQSSGVAMVTAVLRFHVMFTIRCILQELVAPMPGDAAFKPSNNPLSSPAFDRLCREFDVSKHSDFRYNVGPNKGLGFIYNELANKVIKVADVYPQEKAVLWQNGLFHFADQPAEWGKDGLWEEEALDHIEAAENRSYHFFVPQKSLGLM